MEESFETQELKEEIESAVERAEKVGEEAAGPRWTVYLSLSTAIIAVLAAIASLESGSLSNDALLLKNEAVLTQAKASDQWSYYQAKGLKGIIYSTQADAIGNRNGALSHGYRDEATRYKNEQADINTTATGLEKKVETLNEESDHQLEGHHKFALSVTLFQVGIALSAIAALTKRKPMWWMSLVISAGGIFFFLKGLMLLAPHG